MRSTGRGATRIAARTVPRTRDPAALSADTFSVIQKASRIVWPSLLTKSIMAIPAIRLTAPGEPDRPPARSDGVYCWNGMSNLPMAGGVSAGTCGRFLLRAARHWPSSNMARRALSTAVTPLLSPFLSPIP